MAASVSVSPVLYVLTHYSKSFLLDLWNEFNAHVILNPPEYSLHETPCRRLWGAAALSALWKPNLLILIILRLSFMWQAVVCFCVQLCMFLFQCWSQRWTVHQMGTLVWAAHRPSVPTSHTEWNKNINWTSVWSTKQPTKKLRKCSPF